MGLATDGEPALFYSFRSFLFGFVCFVFFWGIFIFSIKYWLVFLCSQRPRLVCVSAAMCESLLPVWLLSRLKAGQAYISRLKTKEKNLTQKPTCLGAKLTHLPLG